MKPAGEKSETCPWCRLITASSPADSPVHAYLEASPGCWRTYGELLAREYSDTRYMAVHGLTVDAYALQHPGTARPADKADRRLKSIWTHYASLYAFFEKDIPLSELARVKQETNPKIKAALEAARPKIDWPATLPSPEKLSNINVKHVLEIDTAEEYRDMVHRWARHIYDCWEILKGPIKRELFSA